MRLYILLRRLMKKDDRIGWIEHLRRVHAVYRFEHKLKKDYPAVPRAKPHTPKDCFALIQNFARPQNMDTLARICLNVPSIRVALISNNNPDWNMGRWLAIPSGRLWIMNQPEQMNSVQRFFIVDAGYGTGSYIFLDDDIFLRPEQIERLCQELHKDPSVPHGIYGQEWRGDHFQGGISGREGHIDVISRVYACTRAHVQEFFRLGKMLGHPKDHPIWRQSLWDDILLSFCGNDRPRIHDVGPFLDCPTQGRKDTATWRRDDFHATREAFYKKLRTIKPQTARREV